MKRKIYIFYFFTVFLYIEMFLIFMKPNVSFPFIFFYVTHRTPFFYPYINISYMFFLICRVLYLHINPRLIKNSCCWVVFHFSVFIFAFALLTNS